ncbi:MAG TPA: cyclopropane-fatty-acyl-phospholipid synthase family protein, partial [Bryobacteraceae bacterium]|nr:cyclopropane-fatty-acyl-phospholipid synthase family protein [Bryobacteraceae bacterium]
MNPWFNAPIPGVTMLATKSSLTHSAESTGSHSWLEKRLLPLIWNRIGPAPVRVVLGSGAVASPPDVVPRFTVWIRDLRTLAQLVLDAEIAFGEAWIDGRIRVTGDLTGLLETVYASMGDAHWRPAWYSRLVSQWTDKWQANTLEGSRNNIHSHYDLGNDFYRLWLDPELVYTCAYFPSASTTLEEAQTAKMEYICRKLRLRPGETVAEAGCGWGSLALYMARNYGVRVKAFNISREQIRHAQQRAREEGLQDRVEFVEDDYRNASGRFDAFLSVGMLEHVGRENYGQFGQVIHQLIGDHGRG